jgi:hypothetical protein
MIGTEFLPPQSQLANQQPKFQDTGRGSVDATTVVRPLYSNVNGIPIMSRISSDPQVEFGAFQKMQESIHNFEYRMDKLENRINALTENIKQIVMDQRRTQKYASIMDIKHKYTSNIYIISYFIHVANCGKVDGTGALDGSLYLFRLSSIPTHEGCWQPYSVSNLYPLESLN